MYEEVKKNIWPRESLGLRRSSLVAASLKTIMYVKHRELLPSANMFPRCRRLAGHDIDYIPDLP